MSNKIINISGKSPSGSEVIPPVPLMVEQIWRGMPSLGRVIYQNSVLGSSMEELLQATLETQMLLRSFASHLGVPLPTPSELRKKIAEERKSFLTKVLAKKDLKPEQVEAVKREIQEIGEYLTKRVDENTEKVNDFEGNSNLNEGTVADAAGSDLDKT